MCKSHCVIIVELCFETVFLYHLKTFLLGFDVGLLRFTMVRYNPTVFTGSDVGDNVSKMSSKFYFSLRSEHTSDGMLQMLVFVFPSSELIALQCGLASRMSLSRSRHPLHRSLL